MTKVSAFPSGRLGARNFSAHRPAQNGWLALDQREPFLPAEQPIIDCHHHLWRREGAPYLPEQYLKDLADAPTVEKTVFIECRTHYDQNEDPALQSLGETRFAANVPPPPPAGSRSIGIAAAICGFVDLSIGVRSGELLDRHIAEAGGRLRSIRNIVAWHPDSSVQSTIYLPPEHLLSDDRFIAGFGELSPRNLAFETWLYHTQLGELAALARTFPDTTIVINHLGGPIGIGPYAGRLDRSFREWQAGVEEIAPNRNVVMKFSGIGMSIMGFGFDALPKPPTSDQIVDIVGPYFEFLFRTFGEDRVMFGSNFPVDKQSFSYRNMWNSFHKLSVGMSRSAYAKLFYENSRKLYGL